MLGLRCYSPKQTTACSLTPSRPQQRYCTIQCACIPVYQYRCLFVLHLPYAFGDAGAACCLHASPSEGLEKEPGVWGVPLSPGHDAQASRVVRRGEVQVGHAGGDECEGKGCRVKVVCQVKSSQEKGHPSTAACRQLQGKETIAVGVLLWAEFGAVGTASACWHGKLRNAWCHR